MSQDETENQGANTNPTAGSGTALSKMMRQGRSFSGYERNCCFLNTGAGSAAQGRFANISAVSGLDFPDDGRAVALVDWDHDGDLDMWISNRNAPRLRLMRNELAKNNHFLALRLVGNGKTTNRDAIGARVEVVLDRGKGQGPSTVTKRNEPIKPKQLPLIKTLRAGEGFLSQSSKWLHFGLGEAENIEKVIIHWPGGDVEQFTDLKPNRRYQLSQGTGLSKDLTQPIRTTKLAPKPQQPFSPSQAARVPLVQLLKFPKSQYAGFDGRLRDFPIQEGRLLLVNLWASWCGPCKIELDEFSKRSKELRAKGIDVLGLSVEGFDDAQARAKALRFTTKAKFPFPVGLATDLVLSRFQNQHNLHVVLNRQLPLPSSFLIDRRGRLSVIYKGSVSVEQLLKDAAHSEGDRIERMTRSAPIPGQAIRNAWIERSELQAAVAKRFFVAKAFRDAGKFTEAVRQYSDALSIKPDSFMAHNNLGFVLASLGRNKEAIAHFQESIRINSDAALPHYNLANLLQGQRQVAEAIEHYRLAILIDPDFADAHLNLGITLQGTGRLDEAIKHFQHRLRIKPNDAVSLASLGVVFSAQGKIAKSVEYLQRAVKADTDYAIAHNNLANSLRTQQNSTKAIEHYQRAIQIKPDYANAHFNLANILQSQGKSKKAVEHYNSALDGIHRNPFLHARLADALRDQGDISAAVRHYLQALNIKSDLPQVLNNLAWVRATHADAEFRGGAQAIDLAQRQCKLVGYQSTTALNTLAAAYAEAGRFDDAIRWQSKAIDLASTETKKSMQSRLTLYKAGKPYRE